LYPEARPVLDALHEVGIPIAVASRSPTPEIATKFLQDLGLLPMFVTMEIHPSGYDKSTHFAAIEEATGIRKNDMLFFDGELPLLLLDDPIAQKYMSICICLCISFLA
jgi:magnesium-dependent phosphatase 1